jgi:hypothetical protein
LKEAVFEQKLKAFPKKNLVDRVLEMSRERSQVGPTAHRGAD